MEQFYNTMVHTMKQLRNTQYYGTTPRHVVNHDRICCASIIHCSGFALISVLDLTPPSVVMASAMMGWLWMFAAAAAWPPGLCADTYPDVARILPDPMERAVHHGNVEETSLAPSKECAQSLTLQPQPRASKLHQGYIKAGTEVSRSPRACAVSSGYSPTREDHPLCAEWEPGIAQRPVRPWTV